jgi:SAM-dependent methyltransferase
MAHATHASAFNAHYARGDLGAAILDALRAAGKNPNAPTSDDLAPVDQFHIGGKAATMDLARLANVRPGQTLLDVGGGLGGPARTMAQEFGCTVIVADLTAEYCRVGALLTERTRLAERVAFVHANALDLPFADAAFDLVWTQHSSMNIEAKDRLYAELHRVVRSGGRFALHEVMTGRRFPVRFPVPWATDQTLSYLCTPAGVRELLRDAGFVELAWADVTESTLATIMAPPRSGAVDTARSPLGLRLLLGDACGTMMQNLVCNLAEGRLAIVRGVLERR